MKFYSTPNSGINLTAAIVAVKFASASRPVYSWFATLLYLFNSVYLLGIRKDLVQLKETPY